MIPSVGAQAFTMEAKSPSFQYSSPISPPQQYSQQYYPVSPQPQSAISPYYQSGIPLFELPKQTFWQRNKMAIIISIVVVGLLLVAGITAVIVVVISNGSGSNSSGSSSSSAGSGEYWISSVESYSSQYSSSSWSAKKVIGAPNVYPKFADNIEAWTAYSRYTSTTQFLVLKIEKVVRISQVHLYETYYPGALISIEARDPNGSYITLWQGSATSALSVSRIYKPTLSRTDVSADTIRVKFDFSVSNQWYELDAVKVVGA
ncbi:F-box and leucine-rich repeat protein 4 [Nowakowskiella sp. JEL0407]|nr:F-box and leucine-rich repeat protein 4 [Nowakowskiella sp. JEL0407]